MAERLNAALDGRYTIERELGEGGMATVYLADDIKHERKVALKVLKPELAAVVGAERFLAEIKTTFERMMPTHTRGLLTFLILAFALWGVVAAGWLLFGGGSSPREAPGPRERSCAC